MATAAPKRATKKAPAAKKTASAKRTGAVKTPPPVVDLVEEETAPAPVVVPTTDPTPSRSRVRPLTVVLVVATVLGAVLLSALGGQERGGPPHTYASLSNGAPATLYVPGKLDDGQFPEAPPAGERPPVVIVAHGFSADQQVMSAISRSLAKAGYAVLALDFRGHGSNTARFGGDLHQDLEAALDYVDRSPYVDRDRIALLGHSMGASAVLETASLDARVKAVIPVSGGDAVNDAVMPANVLLLAGSGDPASIRDRQVDLERELEGQTNVKRLVIGGKDHVTILWANSTIRESVAWLNDAFDITPARAGRLDDPRLGTAFLYLLVALVLLFGIGVGVARLAPIVAPVGSTATDGGTGLLIVMLALVAAMPLLAVGSPASFVPILVGDAQFGYIGLAGAGLFIARALGVRRLATSPRWVPARWGATIGVAAVGMLAIYVLLSPLNVVFHRMVPTPARLLVWATGTVLIAPFFLAAESLIRRGSLRAAIGWGAASKLLTLIVTFIGVAVGFLPGVITLILPILALLYVMVEVFAAGVYSRGRNVAVIALVEAAFIAWLASVGSAMV